MRTLINKHHLHNEWMYMSHGEYVLHIFKHVFFNMNNVLNIHISSITKIPPLKSLSKTLRNSSRVAKQMYIQGILREINSLHVS